MKPAHVLGIALWLSALVGLIPVTKELLADASQFSWVVMKSKTVTGSSALIEKGKPASFYDPANATDGKVDSAWCTGSGKSVGETLEIKFAPTPAEFVAILNGYGRTMDLYLANNRIKDFELTVTEQSGRTHTQRGTFDPDCLIAVRIKILSVYPGARYKDTCIAEVSLQNTPDYNLPAAERARREKLCR